MYTTTRPTTWDYLAHDTLGDAFRMDELMLAQPVKDFDSPVYSYDIPRGASIIVPQDVEQSASVFKAIWED